ncbi:MAG: diguanylate cyclase [Eubacterium sp.]|nr:diguanylate cyclase [Eubacterium sp.]
MRERITFNKLDLQLIAIGAMLIDHIAWAIVDFWSPVGQIMHVIGRLTIPIMCYFIAEGFKKTHNLSKYIKRLAAFYVVSIIPFYLFFSEEYGYRQNIIFDHLISLLILTVLEHQTLKRWQKALLTALLFAVSAIIGGWPITPALFTLIFYYGKTFKQQAKWFIGVNVLTVAVVAFLSALNQSLYFARYDWTWYDRAYLLGFMLALPILARYNGEKGNNTLGRYFFYGFYPVHLLVLTLFRCLASGSVSNYTIYLWLHIVSLLIVFIMLVGVLQARASRMQSAVVMFLVLESFYIVGFIIEILSTEIETIYMACVVEYFGELLMLVAFLIFASECGRIKIPLFIYIAHVLVAFILVYSVATSIDTGFFYSDILLTEFDGHTKAEYIHYTGYYISVVYICVVIAEMLFIMINSLIKGTKIEKRRVGMLFGALMFIWIPYTVTLTGITGGYEVPVIGVLGAAVFLTLCFYKYGTLDSVAIVSESALAKAEEGVIIIDDRLLVTFSNATAAKIVGDDSLVNSNAGNNETLQNIVEGRLTEIEYDGKVYEIRVEQLKHASYTQGYTIWLLDATKHRELLEEVNNIANHDALTGLYNRRHFKELVTAEIECGPRGTLVISDMDNFKAVNDTYGHKKGDSVLVGFASILMEYPEDILYPCRIGGDEFMFYLRGVTKHSQIEKIISEIMEKFTEKYAHDSVKCTLSVGAAVNEEKALEFSELYKVADKKLYIAKESGKNMYVI